MSKLHLVCNSHTKTTHKICHSFERNMNLNSHTKTIYHAFKRNMHLNMYSNNFKTKPHNIKYSKSHSPSIENPKTSFQNFKRFLSTFKTDKYSKINFHNFKRHMHFINPSKYSPKLFYSFRRNVNFTSEATGIVKPKPKYTIKSSDGPLKTEIVNSIVTFKLQNPASLNALTHEIIKNMRSTVSVAKDSEDISAFFLESTGESLK